MIAGIPCSSSETSMIARRSTGSVGAPLPLSPVIDVTSPPAQNPRPAPVSTTTRTRSSFASARSSSRSARTCSRSRALSRSGRSSVTVTVAPASSRSRSTSMLKLERLGRLDEGEDLLGTERGLASPSRRAAAARRAPRWRPLRARRSRRLRPCPCSRRGWWSTRSRCDRPRCSGTSVVVGGR